MMAAELPPQPLPWSGLLNYHFDDQQFAQWRALLEERTGMEVPETRRGFLESSIRRRMQEVGYDNFQAYYDWIVSEGPVGNEWYELVDRVTVQETRFFRDPQAMELVGDHLKAQWTRAEHPVTLWSVGCATGEEAYGLAILCAEIARRRGSARLFSVTGSDLSAAAIMKARHGFYATRKLEPIKPMWRKRYFDSTTRGFVVKPELASRVCFTRLNIAEADDTPLHDLDVIYCQNLLIYFRRWRRRDIVHQLIEKLRPGGLLVLGPGELTGFTHDALIPIPNKHCLAFLKKRPSTTE